METMATDRNTFKTHCSKSVKRCANNFEIRKTIPKQLRKTEKQLRKNNSGKKRIWEKRIWGKKESGKKTLGKKNLGKSGEIR